MLARVHLQVVHGTLQRTIEVDVEERSVETLDDSHLDIRLSAAVCIRLANLSFNIAGACLGWVDAINFSLASFDVILRVELLLRFPLGVRGGTGGATKLSDAEDGLPSSEFVVVV